MHRSPTLTDAQRLLSYYAAAAALVSNHEKVGSQVLDVPTSFWSWTSNVSSLHFSSSLHFALHYQLHFQSTSPD
jgi:hypothetical protein